MPSTIACEHTVAEQHIDTLAHTHGQIGTHDVRTRTHTQSHTHAHTCTQRHIHKNIHAHVHTVHTHTHMHTYSSIHTNMCTGGGRIHTGADETGAGLVRTVQAYPQPWSDVFPQKEPLLSVPRGGSQGQ